LAAELADRLGVDATLIPGGRGIFDVRVEGALVFSKRQVGRFPRDGEVAGLLADRAG
jgi:predicted Rdx family selenoprotein